MTMTTTTLVTVDDYDVDGVRCNTCVTNKMARACLRHHKPSQNKTMPRISRIRSSELFDCCCCYLFRTVYCIINDIVLYSNKKEDEEEKPDMMITEKRLQIFPGQPPIHTHTHRFNYIHPLDPWIYGPVLLLTSSCEPLLFTTICHQYHQCHDSRRRRRRCRRRGVVACHGLLYCFCTISDWRQLVIGLTGHLAVKGSERCRDLCCLNDDSIDI